MRTFTSKEEYMSYFQNILKKEREEAEELDDYLNEQFHRLEEAMATISNETFWQCLPEILGVDAKLNLMIDMISFKDFSNRELIQIIENDYLIYYKELYGYDLGNRTKFPLIFNIV